MNDITAVAPRQNRFSWRALSPWLISAAVLLILPFVLDSGTAFTLMNVIAVNIVFALSYNMLLGQGGLLSFGHAVFFGLGSYAAMHAMNAIDEASYAGEGFWAHIPVVSMPLVGMIAGGLVALVLAITVSFFQWAYISVFCFGGAVASLYLIWAIYRKPAAMRATC